MKTFHIFYSYSKTSHALKFAYNRSMKSVLKAILFDPPREKHECPALIMNNFLKDKHGQVKNKYENLAEITGWFALDVDDAGKLVNLVEIRLFERCKELKIVWISSSGKGVKAVGYSEALRAVNDMAISAAEKITMYKNTYITICADIRKATGLKIKFDTTGGRPHQPVFLNSDPHALHRDIL